MARLCLLVLCGCLLPGNHALEQRETLDSSMNPIRKVVTLLQSMQKKVAAEGEKEQKLFDAFMCYCKKSRGSLEESISAGGSKITELKLKINASF